MSYAAVTVGATPTLIVPANNARRGYIISNPTGTNIYIGPDSSIDATTGIVLLGFDRFMDDGSYRWQGNVYGIVASGSATVNYWEW